MRNVDSLADLSTRLPTGPTPSLAPLNRLLAEAMEMTGIEDSEDVIRVALGELVERRRFQRWVDQGEGSGPGHT